MQKTSSRWTLKLRRILLRLVAQTIKLCVCCLGQTALPLSTLKATGMYDDTVTGIIKEGKSEVKEKKTKTKCRRMQNAIVYMTSST